MPKTASSSTPTTGSAWRDTRSKRPSRCRPARRRSASSLPATAADLGAGGQGTLYVNDKPAGEGRIEHTNAAIFSADETADVGHDDATPVTEDYRERDNKFNGKIERVTIELK